MHKNGGKAGMILGTVFAIIAIERAYCFENVQSEHGSALKEFE
jgi:hypothetical protein